MNLFEDDRYPSYSPNNLESYPLTQLDHPYGASAKQRNGGLRDHNYSRNRFSSYVDCSTGTALEIGFGHFDLQESLERVSSPLNFFDEAEGENNTRLSYSDVNSPTESLFNNYRDQYDSPVSDISLYDSPSQYQSNHTTSPSEAVQSPSTHNICVSKRDKTKQKSTRMSLTHLSVEQKKDRSRDQNKVASRNYRANKKARLEQLQENLMKARESNQALKSKYDYLINEIEKCKLMHQS